LGDQGKAGRARAGMQCWMRRAAAGVVACAHTRLRCCRTTTLPQQEKKKT
jgi:hypothetical protein